MAELDFKRDTQIDPDILEIHWLRQSSLYMSYAEESARADDRVRKLKHDLEVASAKADQRIRISMEGEGKKITEAGIKALILQDENYLKTLVEYNDAQYHADLCSSAVKAMDTKKQSLQALVQLIACSYIASPKVPRELKKEVKIYEEGMQKQKEEVQERALSRRTRKGEEKDESKGTD